MPYDRWPSRGTVITDQGCPGLPRSTRTAPEDLSESASSSMGVGPAHRVRRVDANRGNRRGDRGVSRDRGRTRREVVPAQPFESTRG
jgi:hypothetical protein